jgi:hypothetical protein
MSGQGQAIHFLKRLKRASDEEAEQALWLYHHPEVLRFVLGEVRLPSELERVAVSLHEKDQGPYLVTSREGGFITCLSRGMAISELHLLPYGQLQGLIARYQQVQERTELARELVGPGNELEKLMKRLMTKGEGLSREEMLALSVMQPAIKAALLPILLDTLTRTYDLAETLLKRKRLKAQDRDSLRTYYWGFHAIGHLSVLIGMNGPRGLEWSFSQEKARNIINCLQLVIIMGNVGLIMRVLYLVGMMGKLLIREFKKMVLHPELGSELLFGVLGLVVIGLRNKKLYPQALKTFKALDRAAKSYPELVIDYTELLMPPESLPLCLYRFNDPESYYKHLVQLSQNLFWQEFLEEPHPDYPSKYKFDRIEDVREDMALVNFSLYNVSFRNVPRDLFHVIGSLPWVARCKAEDFFWPGDFCQHVFGKWVPEKSLSLLNEGKSLYHKKTPIRKEEREPGRNDPCPCGSGKKYKRCCLLRTDNVE